MVEGTRLKDMADTQARHSDEISIISQRLDEMAANNSTTTRILAELKVTMDSFAQKQEEMAPMISQMLKGKSVETPEGSNRTRHEPYETPPSREQFHQQSSNNQVMVAQTPSTVVFQSTNSLGKVSVGQCIAILEHKRLGGFVIDAWAEHVKTLYAQIELIVQGCVVFPSCLWGEVKSPRTSAILRRWFDNKIEDNLLGNVWLFPLNPCLNNRSKALQRDHWVLLKYMVQENKWEFYNSLPPRTPNDADHYLKQCRLLITYVEEQMRKVLVKVKPTHPLLRRSPSQLVVDRVPSWIQEPTTVDCGVVVCNLIENVMLQFECGVGEYSNDTAGSYRCKMVHWLLKPEDLVVTEE